MARSESEIWIVLLSCILVFGMESFAHAETESERIARIREFPRWKKEPLSKKELQKCLNDLQSSNDSTRKDALERIALAKPDLSLTRQVVKAAEFLKKSFPDDEFYRKLYQIICDSWESAEVAAETLNVAKSRGGYKFLEQLILGGNGLERRRAATTLMWMETPEAADLMIRHYDRDKLVFVGALKKMGPVAVPATLTLFESPEWPKRVSAAQILKEIATEDDLPLLQQQLEAEDKKIVQLELEAAIAAVEGRQN